MAQQNFLLGKGERMTAEISMKSGGGPKQAPYTPTRRVNVYVKFGIAVTLGRIFGSRRRCESGLYNA